jgi:3-oxoacyl-[acyl-carrier protein] reductase
VDLGIAGKRAVVIGGSDGLGLACSEALAAEGVKLALFARTEARLNAVAGDLASRHGVDVLGIAGDVTRQEDVRALRDRLAEAGGADILVLNTPRPPSPMRDFLAETEDDRWERAYRDQLEAALFVLRHVTPLLLGKGWGRIVGITSASVKQPMPRHALSSIFRAGIQAALKHLVDEVAPHGVTVNAVAPATVMTPTFAQFHDLEARVAAVPLKRPGRAEELGGTVAFLASQQAGFLTGQLLQLDGGMTRSLT